MTGDGIDLDVLLAVSARHQGLDPDQPSPVMGPVLTNLVTEVGPLIVHPLATGHDLKWLAAGLDALARAAETAAHAADQPDEPNPPRWRYTLRGKHVEVSGDLRAAEPDSATIGVPADELANLVTLLYQVDADPAYRAWWDKNTQTQRYWHVQVRDGVAYAHSRTDKYQEFPEPERWRLRGAITLHLSDIAHLRMGLASLTDANGVR